MSEPELTVSDRLEERPRFEPKRVAQVKPRDLGIRFLAGGLTSVGAGLVTLAFGPRAGGIFLAFPAILAASLTLIEEQEDSAEAREDSRGALVGGAGMAAFAVVAAVGLGQLAAGVALALAALAWVVVVLAGYFALWWR
jgi:Protein of unknown function (DUF3147)